eukprot:CAMPEP_0176499656 /NCGR_PEP_ID=MMETSP0200_2-20121128/13056_1 /TAXON_ID=947934 /ORGANISM="Chaetoceros sp., Strain GSL56" /LENGTH=550 /DNA_ID=CAMNT_0017898115 /DNA_START=158 /DNA_END=1810 /DNA_ORIENTATION=+
MKFHDTFLSGLMTALLFAPVEYTSAFSPHYHHHHQQQIIRSIGSSSRPLTITTTCTVSQSIPARVSCSTCLFAAAVNKEKGTIQILMSDTGGGHRASANALRDAFDELYPGQIEVDIVDIFTDYGPFFPLNSFVPIYKIMAEYPILWDITYKSGATPLGLWFNELMLEIFCFEPFKECMSRASGNTDGRADMVVSVHPLTQDIPLKILNYLDSEGKSRTQGRTTPFATVVTDLGGAHPTWFNPGVDKCFVPSDALNRAARDRNVLPEQIVQYGLPIRRGFWSSSSEGGGVKSSSSAAAGGGGGQKNFWEDWLASMTGNNNNNINPRKETRSGSGAGKDKLRNTLGLKPNLPTVLIVGGGDGMGGIIPQAKAMGEKLSAKGAQDGKTYQMVVVCGNNQNAKQVLSSFDWGENVNVVVNGFVNNMDEWMRSSDVIVTKAGPGTIAEASICGLPCMLSSYLPGQEEGNVPFVQEAGFGTYSGNPVTIADTVSTWLSSPEMLSTMKEAALAAARPSATLDIAGDLATMLFDHKKKLAQTSSKSKQIDTNELVPQ